MPKSRNRKNHKKKVASRNQKLAHQKNQMAKQMEELQKMYVEEMDKKAKKDDVDSGEVPLTL
jgi:RNase P subunit RPR2